MPSEFKLPQSLVAATDLIFDFMRREEDPDGLRSIRTPVLLFTGPRGAGKTQVLYKHRDRAAGTYPCAYLDGEWPLASTWDMLLLLAFELKRLGKDSEYAALTFPRLTAGEIVITADLDRASARQQISDLLAAARKTKGVLENTVAALARGLAQSLGAMSRNQVATDIAASMADLAGKYAAEALLGSMSKRNSGRAVLFGPGLEWWGHQGRGLGGDPIDRLVTLWQDADRARSQPRDEAADAADQRGNREARTRVTGQLWAAFLADLRASFADRKYAVNWTRNCVVLLDNAETEVARLFLTELLNERDKRSRDQPDPLTVAVTSRGGLIQPVRLGGLTPLADAGWQHYRERPVPEAGRWWYPVALPVIDWQETGKQLAMLELPAGNIGQLTTAVHALAAGHLGTTRTLVAALAEQPIAAGELNPPALLEAPEPATFTSRQRTVQEAMLEALLATLDPASQQAVDDLVTCAAARHREAAWRLSTEPSLMRQLPSEEEGVAGEGAAIFTSEFWYPDAAGTPAFLYPVLRRLLLRRLAARQPDRARDTASWTDVHAWLRHRARTDGKQGAELYHTLALAGAPLLEIAAAVGEDRSDPLLQVTPQEYVARQLADQLRTFGAQEWLDLVACVTAAPNRLDHMQPLRDHVRALTSWAAEDKPHVGAVARYVVRSWIGADPLSAPHWWQLLREMAKEVEFFAPHSDDAGLAVLRDEADRYREIAGYRESEANWREVARFWMARVRTADEANRRADR